MLKEEIIKDRLLAMKEGNQVKKNVLSTLIAELDRKSKTPSDSDVIAQVKKLIESNIECNCVNENDYLICYLPKSLSDDELTSIIIKEIKEHNYSSMKDMGKVMSYLTSNYPGQYDGKLASNIIKSNL